MPHTLPALDPGGQDGLRSREQVARLDTRWAPAAMEHHRAPRHAALGQLEGQPADGAIAALPPDAALPVGVADALPDQAAAPAPAGPGPEFGRQGGLAHHAVGRAGALAPGPFLRGF